MLLKRGIVGRRDHICEKSPGAIDQLICATQQHDIRMFAHESHLNFKSIGQRDIVRVHARQEFAARERDGIIQ